VRDHAELLQPCLEVGRKCNVGIEYLSILLGRFLKKPYTDKDIGGQARDDNLLWLLLIFKHVVSSMPLINVNIHVKHNHDRMSNRVSVGVTVGPKTRLR